LILTYQQSRKERGKGGGETWKNKEQMGAAGLCKAGGTKREEKSTAGGKEKDLSSTWINASLD